MAEVREIGSACNQRLLDLSMACVPRASRGTVFHLDRSPCYFQWIARIGEDAKVLGVFEGERLIATASFVRRASMWAGQTMPMHYVFDVKVRPEYRKSRAAYRLLRELKRQLAGRPTYSLMLEQNDAALGLVGGRAMLREYRRADRVRLFLWPLMLPAKVARGFGVVESDDGLWANCYERWKVSRNLAPAHAPAFRTDEPRCIAVRDGKPLAIAALVTDDPRRKVALRLGTKDRAVRAVLNVLGPLMHAPRIPGEGGEFRRGFVAHLLYDPDDSRSPGAAMALLAHFRRRLRRRGVPLMHLGLSERDALVRTLERRPDVRTFSVAAMVTETPDDPQRRPLMVNFHET